MHLVNTGFITTVIKIKSKRDLMLEANNRRRVFIKAQKGNFYQIGPYSFNLIYVFSIPVSFTPAASPETLFRTAVTLFYLNAVYLDVKSIVTDGGMVLIDCIITLIYTRGRYIQT